MKNRILLFFTFCFSLFSFSASAQEDKSGINKKAIESYNKAIEKIQQGKYTDAVESLKEAIQRDAKYIDAYLSLAGVYGQIKNNEQSVVFYEKAFALDSNYTSGYRLSYSISLAQLGQFEKALNTINAMLQKPITDERTKKSAEYRKKTFQFAVDFAKAHTSENYVFAPQNLGDNVNTAESEYFPSISIEGNQLVFTRLLNNRNEDFFWQHKEWKHMAESCAIKWRYQHT
jgi:Tfp pilus assembly protein PilF